MNIGKLYKQYGLTLALAVLTILLTVACSKEEPSSVQPTSAASIPNAGKSVREESETSASAKESVRTAFRQEEQVDRQAEQGSEPKGDTNRNPIEAVLRMYEALQADDSESYFQHADIPSVRISPAKLKVLIEEAGKREVRPERFMVFDKEMLDQASRQLLAITYGSQAEIVLEELSQGDHNLWFVTAFTDGLKVVEQSTIYPGAYELGREAAMEELIAVEIRHTAEDRAFLAAKAKMPVLTPVQTVSLLYQAAQAEDQETFYAISGGAEGYFSGHYVQDMVEFTEWMKSFESVQHVRIEPVSKENIAENYRVEFDKRFGSAWQFIVAWGSEGEASYQGTYWIMAPGGDESRYVVRQVLTANLESFFR